MAGPGPADRFVLVASPRLWLMTELAPLGALPMNCPTVVGGRRQPGPPPWPDKKPARPPGIVAHHSSASK